MDAQDEMNGQFLNETRLNNNYRVIFNSIKSPAAVFSITAIRDIFWRVRLYTAQTTTKTLPVFFLESYKVSGEAKSDLKKLKRNVHFEAKMIGLEQI